MKLFRLRRGEDLLESIQKFAIKQHSAAAHVGCCVGRVTHACLRDARGITIREMDEHLEVENVRIDHIFGETTGYDGLSILPLSDKPF